MTGQTERAGRREWVALVTLMLPPLLIALDITVLYYAVPGISEDLRPSSVQQLWIIDIYGFVLASTVITMGNIGDLIGRRRLLMIGAVVFGLASVMAAFSSSAEMLIAARAIQGLAAATQMPSALALVRSIFKDPTQRRSAIATWSVGTAAGLSLGPVISGLLLNSFWWGSIFLINAPIVVVLIVVIRLLVPEARVGRSADRFDVWSSVLSIAALVALIWGVKELAINGFSAVRLASLAVGLVVGGVFMYRQTRLSSPMIDPKMFRYRGFGPALALSGAAFFCVIGFGLFSMQYLLAVLHMRPLEAALWTLTTLPVTGAAAPIAAGIVNKVRPAYVFAAAFLIIAAGYVAMTRLTPERNLLLVLSGIAGIAVGSSVVLALMADLVVAIGPEDRAGSVAALQKACQEFGGALGIAIFGSIGAAVYRRDFDAHVPSGVPAQVVTAARETIGAALGVAQGLPGTVANAVVTTARGAFVESMHVNALVGVGVALAAALFTLARLRHVNYAEKRPDADVATAPAAPAEATAPAQR
jgi:DHA2 family multidrug resistance protein-like MFS transporter